LANYVYIAVTLDGFIASEDGGIDWLTEIPNPGDSDYGFSEFMGRVDGVLMGRKTFETVLGFGEWIYTKKDFVLSRNPGIIPDSLTDRAEYVTGGIPALAESLGKRGFKNLYIDGGRTIQSFLNHDLIDEMIITRIPLLLGRGIPLFASLDRPLGFIQAEVEDLDGQMVKTRYLRKRD